MQESFGPDRVAFNIGPAFLGFESQLLTSDIEVLALKVHHHLLDDNGCSLLFGLQVTVCGLGIVIGICR